MSPGNEKTEETPPREDKLSKGDYGFLPEVPHPRVATDYYHQVRGKYLRKILISGTLAQDLFRRGVRVYIVLG